MSNRVLSRLLETVDHLAIAVEDLEEAIAFFRDKVGFTEVERRTTAGQTTGMESVVMKAGNFHVVLIKGTSPQSQVTRYIEKYGPGVQHVAFRVRNIEAAVEDLKRRGLAFDTEILTAPGLRQAFTQRDPVTGMMFELVERSGEEGFSNHNVQRLFESLEQNNSF